VYSCVRASLNNLHWISLASLTSPLTKFVLFFHVFFCVPCAVLLLLERLCAFTFPLLLKPMFYCRLPPDSQKPEFSFHHPRTEGARGLVGLATPVPSLVDGPTCSPMVAPSSWLPSPLLSIPGQLRACHVEPPAPSSERSFHIYLRYPLNPPCCSHQGRWYLLSCPPNCCGDFESETCHLAALTAFSSTLVR